MSEAEEMVSKSMAKHMLGMLEWNPKKLSQ